MLSRKDIQGARKPADLASRCHWLQHLGALLALVLMAAGQAGTSTTARVPSAEEKVAFFMLGVEAAPLTANTWALEDRGGAISLLEIKQAGPCRYDIRIEKPLPNQAGMFRFEYAVDFSLVTDYAAWVANGHSSAIIIKVEGTIWYSRKIVTLKTGQVLQTIKDGSVDANLAAGGSVERLRSAFADFRTNHCRARAS
jgi:hypothetical protein